MLYTGTDRNVAHRRECIHLNTNDYHSFKSYVQCLSLERKSCFEDIKDVFKNVKKRQIEF